MIAAYSDYMAANLIELKGEGMLSKCTIKGALKVAFLVSCFLADWT